MRAACLSTSTTSRVAAARPAFAAPSVVRTAPRRSEQLTGRGPVVCQGLFGLGLPELAVITGVAVLVFGPSKLPELGRGLGKTMKSFQSAAKEFEQELKSASADDGAEGAPAKPKVDDEKVKKTDA